jgi:hypothetical protein
LNPPEVDEMIAKTNMYVLIPALIFFGDVRHVLRFARQEAARHDRWQTGTLSKTPKLRIKRR